MTATISEKPSALATPQRRGDGLAQSPVDARVGDRLAQRFADKLARGGRDSKTATVVETDRKTSAPIGKGHSFARVSAWGDDDARGPAGADSGAFTIGTSALTPAAAQVEALAHAVVQTDPVVERMASAIAEVADKSAAARMTVSFDARTAGDLASTAVITRDATTGALSIRVTGLVPQVGEARRAALENDLRRGLERRRLMIGTVIVQGSGHA